MFKRFTDSAGPAAPWRPCYSARVAARPPPTRRSPAPPTNTTAPAAPPPPTPPPQRPPPPPIPRRPRPRRATNTTAPAPARRQRQAPGDLVRLAALPGPDRPVEKLPRRHGRSALRAHRPVARPDFHRLRRQGRRRHRHPRQPVHRRGGQGRPRHGPDRLDEDQHRRRRLCARGARAPMASTRRAAASIMASPPKATRRCSSTARTSSTAAAADFKAKTGKDLAVPQDWTDLLTIAQFFKDSAGKYGVQNGYTTHWCGTPACYDQIATHWNQILWSFGGEHVGPRDLQGPGLHQLATPP